MVMSSGRKSTSGGYLITIEFLSSEAFERHDDTRYYDAIASEMEMVDRVRRIGALSLDVTVFDSPNTQASKLNAFIDTLSRRKGIHGGT